MGLWDWYNRPGGIRSIPTWKVALAVIALGVLTSVVLWVLYSLLSAFIFTPVRPR
jgi:antibiotic biosynthesis monooxygenase (ABM) superfamily enzyme